jgi:hypothetical protein
MECAQRFDFTRILFKFIFVLANDVKLDTTAVRSNKIGLSDSVEMLLSF